MSLSYQKLEPVLVRDPITILDNKREYAVLESGSQVTYKAYTTTSVSSSSIQFSCPPPAANIIVDRKQYFTLPIRLTFTGLAPVGQVLLNNQRDAPRAFPINSSIDTLKVTINNQSVSINIADMLHALMRYNMKEVLQESDYSTTPCALDMSQDYNTLYGSNKNPLGNYGNSSEKSVMPRGGFPFTIVSQQVSVNPATPITSIVDMVVTEPLFLSPFYWGHSNGSGFYNVTSMDFNITFLGNAGNRMWSHDSVTAPASTITNIGYQFNGFSSPAFSYPANVPTMLFKYITPQQPLPFDMPITYPYFDVQRFGTDTSNTIAPGGTWNFQSNNLQLNSIPRRVYVFVRERNQDLYNTSTHPDTFFSIETPFSVTFQNKNGLFASATKQQLYQQCVKNHCGLSWTEWSGGPVNAPYTSPFQGGVPTLSTVGSVMCIEFATDVGLDQSNGEAPGVLGQYLLQINGTATNISSRSIIPTLYVVVVSEGSFTIEGWGKASTNIGVLSKDDVRMAQNSPWVSYKNVEEVNGGNFLSGLKDFGKRILDVAKPVNQFLRDTRAISGITGMIPHPGAQAASQIARAIGYGEGGVTSGGVTSGGVVIGGKRMAKSDLRRRIQ